MLRKYLKFKVAQVGTLNVKIFFLNFKITYDIQC